MSLSHEGLAKRSRDPLEAPSSTLKLGGGGKQEEQNVNPPKDEYTKDLKLKASSHPPPSARHAKGLRSLGIAVTIPLFLGLLIVYVIKSSEPDRQSGVTTSGSEKDEDVDMMKLNMNMPMWHPPSWVFGCAWSLFFPFMGFASWLVWTEGGWRQQGVALGLYQLQLVLSLVWIYLFFGLLDIPLAMADIFALALVLIVCLRMFSSAHYIAGNIIKPYLAWVLFAAVLNYKMWVMNYPRSSPAADVVSGV